MTPAPFINLLPINQREHPFMGRSASGWWRPARLGQISGGGMFMGPGNIFAQMPVGYFAAPSGAPLMTPEIRNPEHFQDEQHCYRCPDGSHRAFRFGDRDTALAMGCEVTNYENCAGAWDSKRPQR